jgi:hypothetical protein
MCSAPPSFEQIHHVFKEFQVTALIAGDGNTLGVFLDGGVDDFLHRAVVAQMDHLHAGALQDAPKILMEASWPSKRDVAVTTRTLFWGR